MPVKAVIFDLDGTLIDSLPAINAAFDMVCDALDLARPDREAAQGFVGAGVPVAMQRMLNWAGADPALHGKAVDLMMSAYATVPVAANKLYPGVADALGTLAAQSIPMGLCTNKPEAPTHEVIRALGLGPFGVVVGGDTLQQRKPDPTPLNTCAERLGVARLDTLYVGDSEVDHATAAAAGIPFALFEGGYLNAPLGEPDPAIRFTDWKQFLTCLDR